MTRRTMTDAEKAISRAARAFGRMGGNARARKYSEEELSAIAQKGVATLRSRYTPAQWAQKIREAKAAAAEKKGKRP